jgi:hypothetical protein
VLFVKKGVSVKIAIFDKTSAEQAVTGFGSFSISTTHILQLAATVNFS